MEEINPLDEAEIKHHFRQFYKDHGPTESMRALYEMLVGAHALTEVIIEEQERMETE